MAGIKLNPGMKYGLFGALVMLTLGEWVPQPTGSVVLWSALSLQAVLGFWIIWRRLRLPWLSVGTGAAFLVSAAMIPISARGLNLATLALALPLPLVAAIWIGVLIVPLTVGLESSRNSREWQAWSTRMTHASLWEMLTFRHIPDLHGSSSKQ